MATNKAQSVNVDEIVTVAPAPIKERSLSEQATIVKKEQERKSLVRIYQGEKKVPVTVSPFYAPYLGKVVPVLVNGIRVDIPADGRTYQINETHAGEVIAKIRRIDDMIARQSKAGDVSGNLESHIGELQI